MRMVAPRVIPVWRSARAAREVGSTRIALTRVRDGAGSAPDGAPAAGAPPGDSDGADEAGPQATSVAMSNPRMLGRTIDLRARPWSRQISGVYATSSCRRWH